MWAATYRGIYPDRIIDDFDFAWHTQRDLARIKSEQYLVFLIVSAGQRAGYLILQKGEPFRLMSLYLLPEFQRQGIGGQAFRLVRDYCRGNGISEFICHCHPDNENALAFYERMGGRIIDRDEGNETRDQDSVVLAFPV